MLVGPSGLEPLTLPTSRDALTTLSSFNHLLNEELRLPILDLAFAPARFGQTRKFLLVHEPPRTATSREGAVSALVFFQSPL